uniref:LOB domain-containing protein n=1 Tax=Oryza barthii TaxID=65489 RepID=A0A0D3FL92_9ORYZ
MSSSSSPCAACKLLRRKCTQGCVFAPYFPPDQPAKFANVHKVFGASNVTKLLNDLQPEQREDATEPAMALPYHMEPSPPQPSSGHSHDEVSQQQHHHHHHRHHHTDGSDEGSGGAAPPG